MEPYVKNNNVNDITYQSELIPPSCFRKKAGGINSQTLRYNLWRSYELHKLSAH